MRDIEIHGETPRVVPLRTARGVMRNFNYLVIDPRSRGAVLIDPSWQIEVIEEALAREAGTVEGILVTHSHPDHIDLAQTLARRHACPIWMSQAEIDFSGFQAPQLVPIDEGQIELSGLTIDALLTPGHTPGCVCYRIADNLFTGDVLFAEGCGICPDLEAAKQMYFSLQRLLRELPAHTKVYPGHSFGLEPGQSLSRLRRENIYLSFSNEHDFAAFRCRSGQQRSRLFDFR